MLGKWHSQDVCLHGPTPGPCALVWNGCARLGDVSYQLASTGQLAFLPRALVSLSGTLKGIPVCSTLYTDFSNIASARQCPEVGVMTAIPSLQLRRREVEQLALGYTAPDFTSRPLLVM